ncbi:hypothetical protein [[Clostridium] colinum]|uniref:hypothetical protein n=1 Tax=[Clostridium] colinum TaxID=36835 RepID=UPI0020258AAA|nr:hypothetical protein [[Clostridium] colinum]
MFEQEVKKKSKVTPGLLIVFGIFIMSMVVIINNSIVVENSIEHINTFNEDKEEM